MEPKPEYRIPETRQQLPPGFARLFVVDGAPADPFADDCAHLDYKRLCEVVKDLAARVTALEAQQ